MIDDDKYLCNVSNAKIVTQSFISLISFRRLRFIIIIIINLGLGFYSWDNRNTRIVVKKRRCERT